MQVQLKVGETTFSFDIDKQQQNVLFDAISKERGYGYNEYEALRERFQKISMENAKLLAQVDKLTIMNNNQKEIIEKYGYNYDRIQNVFNSLKW